MTSSNHGTSPYLGYGYTISAALLWGVSGAAAKFLFQSGITAFQLVQLRLTVTVVSLLLWLAIKNPALLKISRRDIPYFTVFGIFGMATCQFSYLFAISKIQVAAAILLQYLAPGFITLYKILFAKEMPGKTTLIALCGAFCGCFFVVGAYRFDLLALNLAGVISGVMAAVSFAWYSVHGEYGMHKYHPWTVLFYAMVIAAVVWNLIIHSSDAFVRSYTAAQWGWILYVGVLGTLVPFGLYLEGINLIRSTRASITATLEPITAGLVAFIFLNEIMEPLQLAGGILVILSIVYLQLNQKQDDRAPALIRAAAHRPKTE